MAETRTTEVSERKNVDAFFASRGWEPFDYQKQVWSAYLKGQSGLIHAPTGMGKTYAAFVGPVLAHLGCPLPAATPPLTVLWITPLRALATDTENNLRTLVDEVGLPWVVQRRTGDTPSSIKAAQRRKLPSVLITTPESLTILLSYAHSKSLFETLQSVVIDEWHELMGTKRGVQTELAMARLRRWRPELRTWGMSATLGNLDEAAAVLLGADDSGDQPLIITAKQEKRVVIDTLWPDNIERFPWAGHLGLKMLPEVLDELEKVNSALIFTNTRSQTEEWFRALIRARPEWAGDIALHHGSLDRKKRAWVEHALAEGRLRCVVCTSSLDLGVDFTPVDRVFQVGSPKGIGRVLQRAGRSGHQPGAVSRITGIPAHAFELLEFAAARRGADRQQIEPRRPPTDPVDVLVQHAVTMAAGGGFTKKNLLDEVRSTYTYRDLDESTWDWVIDFAETGGGTLKAYEEYKRIAEYKGRYVGTTDESVRRHRMMIGTIVGDPTVTVKFGNGRKLGTIEESFLARLRKDDTFYFAGRMLSLVRINGLEATVKLSKNPKGPIPRWAGGRFSLSTRLAENMRSLIDAIARHDADEEEVKRLAPIIDLQRHWSIVPQKHQLLIERTQTRDGYHVFIYPFAGRGVHEGLSALIAWRLARHDSVSYTLSHNDYGFELLSRAEPPIRQALESNIFSTDSLKEDIRACLNESELARRYFREIARVAGLVFTGFPGQNKSLKQVQATTGLVYDVFERYDRDNPLMQQARQSVLEIQLQENYLRETLERMSSAEIHVVDTPTLTPFAFPIAVDRLRESTISTETLQGRVERIQRQLARKADHISTSR